MKIQNINWYDQQSNDKRPTATVYSNGKLGINSALWDLLPSDIRIGFDLASRTLVIAKGTRKKCKLSIIPKLLNDIKSTGLKLPVLFEFSADPVDGQWYGRVALRRKKSKYDVEQLIALFSPIADEYYRKNSKSTPKNERPAIIYWAFTEIANDYKPSFGDMVEYVNERLPSLLKLANKQFFQYYADCSLDAALSKESDDGFNLYSIISSSGQENETENAVLEKQFLDNLPLKEKWVIKMLKDGYSIPGISESLGISVEEIFTIADSVRKKRDDFYNEKTES